MSLVAGIACVEGQRVAAAVECRPVCMRALNSESAGRFVEYAMMFDDAPALGGIIGVSKFGWSCNEGSSILSSHSPPRFSWVSLLFMLGGARQGVARSLFLCALAITSYLAPHFIVFNESMRGSE